MKLYAVLSLVLLFGYTGTLPTLFRTLEQGAPVRKLAFSPDSSQLAVLSDGGVIRVWDVQNGNKLWRVRAPHNTQSLQFNPNGIHLISLSNSGSFSVWSEGTLRYTWHAVNVPRFLFFQTSALSRDGSTFIMAGGNDRFYSKVSANGLWARWDLRTGQRTVTYTSSSIIEAAFSEDNQYLLLSGGIDSCGRGGGGIQLNSSGTWESMGYSLSRHSGTVWDAHIAGSYLVGSGTTERCFGAPVTWIWDFETGKLIAELRDYTAPLALYGSTLATVYCLSVSENQCALQSLALWNIVDQSSYHILASQGRNYTDVEFSSNGEWLAAATDTGRIDIWLVNASE